MSDSTNETPSKKTQLEDGSHSLSVIKKAVVVLTRLPEYKVSTLRPPTPQQFYSEDESHSSSDSDMQWEPEDNSSDSDFSVTDSKQKTGKPTQNDTKKTPAPQTMSEPAPIIISSAFAYCANEITKVRPDLPEEEVKVGMMVLARKRHMRWQQGKIVEIITRKDGRLKYKVNFVEKGKSLVSGHHIAFDNTAKLEQLYVGARVVVKCQDETFRPAILAELPSRKNRLRFLVFLDDHIPVYIGLPFLHLVCRPFMEGDEIEMTKEELQKWIRAKVKENDLFSTHVQEKYDLLQSLLERRQSQAAHLQNLYKSVAACEVIVKKQYSLLGWEYKDTVSDDDNGITPPSPRQVSGSPTRNAPLLLEDSEKVYKVNGKKVYISLKRQPVVVLTRLSPREIRSYRPTPQDHDREDESLSNLSSDSRWEPDNDSNDLNYSTSSYNTGSNKRRKVDQKDKKTAKRHATPRARTNAGATSNAGKTSTPPADTNEVSPVSMVPTLPQSSHKAAKTKDPPSVQEEKIIVNMNVLARKRDATWQQGKIVEIVTKEGGRLKYKVSLEKGKILVSGHHIAFVCMPKVEQLFVGARVVVKCNSKEPQFFPGIVAELPNRINHMRFLVFLDNKTPVYVGLPLLHLVCKPMTDPLDDIKNEAHKNFLKEYIKNWPYLPQTKYKLRQIINAELDGVQQKCEVQVVDCSLIQVVFQVNQQKEWIYRGSSRLEHMINMRKQLESKKHGMKNKSTATNVSSKMAH